MLVINPGTALQTGAAWRWVAKRLSEDHILQLFESSKEMGTSDTDSGKVCDTGAATALTNEANAEAPNTAVPLMDTRGCLKTLVSVINPFTHRGLYSGQL